MLVARGAKLIGKGLDSRHTKAGKVTGREAWTRWKLQKEFEKSGGEVARKVSRKGTCYH